MLARMCDQVDSICDWSAALVVPIFLFDGTAVWSSWFTAIYFHTPAETMIALVLGLLACQAVT